MKAEIRENAVVLVPETPWDEQVLMTLKQQGVSKIHYEDDWEDVGKLILDGHKNCYDD